MGWSAGRGLAGDNGRVRISAKADYAIRATLELAAAPGAGPVKAEQLASTQAIPLRFLLNILVELKRAGIVASRRGSDGGYQLARPAAGVTLADVIRAVEGPLAQVGDHRPEALHYHGVAAPLQQVWVAVRASLRAVLEEVSLADVCSGRLPEEVAALARAEGSWDPH